MKRFFFVIIGTFLAGAVSPLNGQELKPRGPHPRLFFTPDRIANLQARIQTEPTTAIAWSNLLAGAKSIEELSLAYRMTGEKRFAERVRDAVRRLRWEDAMLMRRDPPWHAGLGAARSCYEAAVAFDSIYDALTPEERKDLAHRIVDRGILPTLNGVMPNSRLRRRRRICPRPRSMRTWVGPRCGRPGTKTRRCWPCDPVTPGIILMPTRAPSS